MCVVSWVLLVVCYLLLLCVACCLLIDCCCFVFLAMVVCCLLGFVGLVSIVVCRLSWFASCVLFLDLRARCVLALSTFGVV